MRPRRPAQVAVKRTEEEGPCHQDIRKYFALKRRRPSGSTLDQQQQLLQASSKLVPRAVQEEPTMPIPTALGGTSPRLRDMAQDDYPGRGETIKCRGMTEYLQMVQRDEDGWQSCERDRLALTLQRCNLAELLGRIERTAMMVRDQSRSLYLRLVRRLLEMEMSRCAAMVESSKELHMGLTRWLTAEGFLSGVGAVAERIAQFALLKETPSLHSNPWDVLLAIEPVVRAEPLLEQSTITHLATLEKEILHCYAWQSEHPLYHLLRQDAHRSHSAMQSSPAKALQAMTAAGNVPEPLTALEFFFRKFLRSAAAVFEQAICHLGVSSQVQRLAWTLFVEAMEAEAELRLLHRRHLLSVGACAIYSVAKLLDEDRSFAQIVAALRIHGPVGDERWYREVIGEGERRIDLVHFYNKIYLERMRTRIYNLRRIPRTPIKEGMREVIESKSDSEDDRGSGEALTKTPFPSVAAARALTHNVTLQVSPSRMQLCAVTPHSNNTRRFALLANFGLHADSTPPDAGNVARRLHF